ncbi:hypothetical protein [Burkholderia multivorans]|uniref:hypothetical protein n=1 Tax=Burkholderia multivorans TaxID=87883 RepID=UPI001C247A84|nr:hypothetical protein [Burkholderia multivorans]MBU9606811.1 hypothetical protein [Burkholderia multivorans]
MTDFADAFRRGQEAAAEAARAREEVDAVFATVKQELLDASEGRIELARMSFEKPRMRTLADMLAPLANLQAPARAEMEPWIPARNPKAADGSWVKLAKWSRPHEGYPCVLSYDSRDVRCHDRESLSDAVGELLASSWGGEKLRSLLNLPLKPVDGADGAA